MRKNCRNLLFSLTITVTPIVMPFGEIVVGSPGSGKSTYCYGKHQLFTALNRPISIVNLDPANDNIPYPCAIDIASLITLQDAMSTHELGPNGGMLYCMEYLEANYDWLEDRLKELGKDAYVLFDLPGQVELSTNHDSLKRIIEKLGKSGFRVCDPLFLFCLSQTIGRCSWLRCIYAIRTSSPTPPSISRYCSYR
jgi:GTPase SAR1 family protein